LAARRVHQLARSLGGRGKRKLIVALAPRSFQALSATPGITGVERETMLRLQIALELTSSVRGFADVVDGWFSQSKSQLLQDLVVVHLLGGMRNGRFAEIGAGDGTYLSNTWLLEKHFGWTGVLAEPNINFHPAIKSARTATLDGRAVCGTSRGSLPMLINSDFEELSTLVPDNADGGHRSGYYVDVDTVGVNQVLADASSEGSVNYLSIDTEGSEIDILESIDLHTYRPEVITIEHNDVSSRKRRFDEIICGHGYRRILRSASRFDAWYVLPSDATSSRLDRIPAHL
jgi:FkbM family methyltransferase